MKKINELALLNSPSEQIEIVSDWWRASAAASQLHPSIDAARTANELWQTLTGEPGKVDYLETVAGDVTAMWAIPKNCADDRVIVCFHGGGYFVGSIYTHRKMYAHLAKKTGCRALILNYSLVPEQTYPTQLTEGVSAYHWLMAQGIKPAHIAFAGDSAGGGLALSTVLQLKEEYLPLPAALVALSPWFDLASTGQSMITNAGKDLIFTLEWVKSMGQSYVGEHGNLKDPIASPLYGNLKGIPPVYIHVGGDELLLDDSRMLADVADKAGVDIQVDIFPHMQHSFTMAAGRAPEADHSIFLFAQWLKKHLNIHHNSL
jgi:epsilon-lactone hydrolase